MDSSEAQTLIDTLAADKGIVALVGAGGKKSTLHRLADAHRAIGTPRIALAATVQTAAPPKSLGVETLTIDGNVDVAIEQARSHDGPFLFAGPPTKPGRFGGLPEQQIDEIHRRAAFDVSMVKADGARMRMIKAPNDREPALPKGTTTVLPVVSARVFGRPLNAKLVHRPERLIDVLDVEIGTNLTPLHIAKLLTSRKGALQRTCGIPVVPIINMVDNAERLERSKEAASMALAMTEDFDRVVLASMISESPLVDVVMG